MTFHLDQALFGYDRGHRMIAASRKLDKDTTYALRTVTDMKVGKKRTHYLTVLPVPSIEAHAFVRTWPAGSAFRPGSVWSHVLLLASKDLGAVDDFRTITRLFKRPKVDSPDQVSKIQSAYSGALHWPGGPPGDHDEDDDGVRATPNLVHQVVLAVYGQSRHHPEVVASDVSAADDVVLGLMSQQWTELRREFSARTRFRPGPSSVAPFAIEVIERASSKSSSEQTPVGEWVKVLTDDLRQPNWELRTFLSRYGPEGRSGRGEVEALTEVFVAAARGSETTIKVLGRHYPTPSDMAGLKLAMFSPDGHPAGLGDMWESEDTARLQALLSFAPGMVGLNQIDARSTVSRWARTDPQAAAATVVNADVGRLGATDVEVLIEGLRDGAHSDWIGRAAAARPDFASALLSNRPDVWCAPDVWTSAIDHEVLLELITAADRPVRERTFRALLRGGLAGSAGELCQLEASLWWSILDVDRADTLAGDELALAGAKRVLIGINRHDMGRNPWPVGSIEQVGIVVAATDPDDGIWRDVAAPLWIDFLNGEVELTADDVNVGVRRDVMALATAAHANTANERGQLWGLVFGRLHESLSGSGTPIGCERTLAAVLPHGPSWDWCGRLRNGLAQVAARDDWTDADLRAVAAGAGQYADDVAATVEQLRKRANPSFIDGVIDAVTWWP